MKLDKKALKNRPWLKYYEEDGIPESIEYPDCSMVDLIIHNAEEWPSNVAYSYFGHKVTYRSFLKKIERAARVTPYLDILTVSFAFFV